MLPLGIGEPVTVPYVLAGNTVKMVDAVLGADRRLRRVVVRTVSPAMNPPGGRVAVRVAVPEPGTPVAVGGAGVRVGVGVGIALR